MITILKTILFLLFLALFPVLLFLSGGAMGA